MRRLGILAASLLLPAAAPAGERWPEFRGPKGDGRSDATSLPLAWSEARNVRWKTAVHDRGWSSPVIWDGQIWMTTATRDGKQLFAVCVDRETGKIVHDRKVFDVEKPEHIADVNSYASPTPAVEAGRVFAHSGTYGTACLDTATGQTVWTRRDLTCDHHEGPGASPILFEHFLIVHVDGCDVQYVVALDKQTGRTVWKTPRSVDYTKIHRLTRKSYATPAVVDAGGRIELVSPCSRAIIGYNPRTGEELWKVTHRGWSMVPRPLYAHGLVFLTIDYDRPELWAIRPGGSGDVTASHVAWKLTRNAPRTPAPLAVGDHLYLINNLGIASCVEAKTGKTVWQERVGGEHWAAPVFADGRIYLFAQDGTARAIEPSPTACKILAENKLDGRIMASPAAAGKAFFVRSETHLYRIEQQAP